MIALILYAAIVGPILRIVYFLHPNQDNSFTKNNKSLERLKKPIL